MTAELFNYLNEVSHDLGLYDKQKDILKKLEKHIELHGQLLPEEHKKDFDNASNINDVINMLEDRISQKVYSGDEIINIVNHNKKLDYTFTFTKVFDLIANDILTNSKKSKKESFMDSLSVFSILYAEKNLYTSFPSLYEEFLDDDGKKNLFDAVEFELIKSSLTPDDASSFQGFPKVFNDNYFNYVQKNDITIDDFFYY